MSCSSVFRWAIPSCAGTCGARSTSWNCQSAVRRELAVNGMRSGLIGGPLPDMLAKRLTIAEDQSTPAAAAAKLQSESPVRRWRLQAHRGRSGKIVASPVYDQLSLLTCEDGQVRGKTYSQAQGLFSILVDPQGDGRVRLSLTPELEYGDSRQQWVGQDGVLRLQSGKPKQTFDKLKLDIALAPNQTLVLSSLAQRPGSLGHYFFTESRRPDGSETIADPPGRNQVRRHVRASHSGRVGKANGIRRRDGRKQAAGQRAQSPRGLEPCRVGTANQEFCCGKSRRDWTCGGSAHPTAMSNAIRGFSFTPFVLKLSKPWGIDSGVRSGPIPFHSKECRIPCKFNVDFSGGSCCWQA